MTVATLNNRVSYAGNGVTTVFSFPNRFLADADLVVLDVLDSTGVETTKTLTTHYTVSGAGDAAGGSVTMLTAPAVGHTLVIYRDPALTQPIDLVNGDTLDVDTGIERGMDRSTLQMQRLRDLMDRSLCLPDGDTGFVAGDMNLPAEIDRASKYLAFDANGLPIASTSPLAGSVPVSAFMETALDDADAAAVVETLRGSLAELAVAPADDDEVLLRDTSGTTGKRQTVANFIKSILDTARAFTAAHTHAGAETHAGDETHSGLESFAKTKFSVPHGPNYLNNISIDATVAANALTATLYGNDGAAPSASNPVQLSFRNSALTTGTTTIATATAATTVTAPDGATLGFIASEDSYVYVYALNSAGTVELAVSGSPSWDTNILQSTTAIGTGSDTRTVLYSTTARTNVAIRFLGIIKIQTGATPGQWGSAATIKAMATDAPPVLAIGYCQTWQDVTGSRAFGSTYTNSTGRPIAVAVRGSAVGGTLTWAVGGTTVQTTQCNVSNQGVSNMIVPPGATYSITSSAPTLELWTELR